MIVPEVRRIRLARSPHIHDVNMPMNQAQTINEGSVRMRLADSPSEDDVTILLDGRRLESKEKVLTWLPELIEIQRRNQPKEFDSSIQPLACLASSRRLTKSRFTAPRSQRSKGTPVSLGRLNRRNIQSSRGTLGFDTCCELTDPP